MTRGQHRQLHQLPLGTLWTLRASVHSVQWQLASSPGIPFPAWRPQAPGVPQPFPPPLIPGPQFTRPPTTTVSAAVGAPHPCARGRRM